MRKSVLLIVLLLFILLMLIVGTLPSEKKEESTVEIKNTTKSFSINIGGKNYYFEIVDIIPSKTLNETVIKEGASYEFSAWKILVKTDFEISNVIVEHYKPEIYTSTFWHTLVNSFRIVKNGSMVTCYFDPCFYQWNSETGNIVGKPNRTRLIFVLWFSEDLTEHSIYFDKYLNHSIGKILYKNKSITLYVTENELIVIYERAIPAVSLKVEDAKLVNFTSYSCGTIEVVFRNVGEVPLIIEKGHIDNQIRSFENLKIKYLFNNNKSYIENVYMCDGLPEVVHTIPDIIYVEGGHDIVNNVLGKYYKTIILPNETFKAKIEFCAPYVGYNVNVTSIELIDHYGVKVLKVS